MIESSVSVQVGTAEVEMQLGRLTAAAGDQAASTQHYGAAADAYRTSLGQPSALGGFADRSNVRYNYACACALAGRSQEAAEVGMSAILAWGGR